MRALDQKEFVRRAKEKHQCTYDYTRVAYVSQAVPVTVICKKHGAFQVNPKQHLLGVGCPFWGCSTWNIKRAPSVVEFVDASVAAHGSRYDYSKVQIKGSVAHKIRCKTHGYFSQRCIHHARGHGCPDCGRERTNASTEERRSKAAKDFVTRACKVHGKRYDYSKAEYVTSQSKLAILCSEHGEFMQSPTKHLSGRGCPKCAVASRRGGALVPFDEFKRRAISVHGARFMYSRKSYVDTRTKMRIKCRVHGVFKQTPHDHIYGPGCPGCKSELLREYRTQKFTDFLRLAIEIHKNKYAYSEKSFTGATGKIEITCPTHGVFHQIAKNHLSGQGCPRCSTGKFSKPHRMVVTWLRKHGIEVQENARVIPDRKLEIDVYLPEYRLGIEVNGVYWHSEDRRRHVEKRILCADAGIQLLQFWDFEIQTKGKIVISMLKSKLGMTTRMFARQLDVRAVESQEAQRFLNDNHIQGARKGTVHVGLYDVDKLMCLASFGKPFVSKGFDWELLRFCSIRGHTVVGGASRLLTWFERQYSPKTLLSFASLMYSDGNVYTQLGFTLLRQSPPSYFWHRGKAVLSRYQTQKHKLPKLLDKSFSPNLTETENMHRHGWARVFDAGTLVFVKHY